MTKNLFSLVCSAFLLFFVSTIAAQPPLCGALKVTTLPAPGDYGGAGQFAVSRQTIANPEPNTPAPVSVYLPSNATAQNRVPVVFFAHGFGGTEFLYYDALLQQLASNGYAVVFAPYTSSILVNHPTRYQQMWAGFQIAVQQFGDVFDTTRVGFAGHSYGAGALPELARRGVAAGWGSNGLFLFSMAPWYSFGANYEQIPASAKLIVQVYWDDGTNQHLIAQNDIWNRLPQITEKKWQVIRAAQTTCELTAGHNVPVTINAGADGTTNALDYWGVWRKLHALSAYTFTGNSTAKTVAFDETHMGRWRLYALRPITPLETSDAPILNTTSSPTFLWSARCFFAQGYPCS
jgi:surfactin synthase thioesterase subunit